MLKELRKIEKRSKSNYIRHLQYIGKIGYHVNEKGYVCYNPAELKEFKRTHRPGRPAKKFNKGE